MTNPRSAKQIDSGQLFLLVLTGLFVAGCASQSLGIPSQATPAPTLVPAGTSQPIPEMEPTAVPTLESSLAPASRLLERGEALYNANCRSCHGGATGGQMMDIPPPHNANGHTWHHPDCQLIDIVLNGSGEMGEMMRRMMGVPEDTPRMPAFKGKLTEEEVEAILTYIKTWWTEEQRQVQARITEGQCG